MPGRQGRPIPATKEYVQRRVSVDANGCWLWQGRSIRCGYGRIRRDGRWIDVHRRAYELWVGPIPDGLHIDHLCRVRRCCNPAHLEAVTVTENNRRAAAVRPVQTHCKHGHEFTPENTRINTDGARVCKECRTVILRRYRLRSKVRR